MRLSDDGLGFDISHPPAAADGFGLMDMRERVAELKGNLRFNSGADHGTEIIFILPLSCE